MKKFILLVLSLLPSVLWANMANPVFEGTLGSRPFVNEYVDVEHEDLHITIDEKFQFAYFHVKYHINSTIEGTQIPFLFYASEFLDSFTVTIDGKAIEVKEMPYDLDIPNRQNLSDFDYLFDFERNRDRKYILLEDDEHDGFYVNLNNTLYFETDILPGKHVIEVNYRATNWQNTWGWVNNYSFRYALSPAKYWKSFGTLNISIDATKFKQDLTSNLGKPVHGSIDSISTWKFDSLPVDVLQINFNPKISQLTQNLIDIGPSRIAYLIGGIFTIFHLLLLLRYRKKFPTKKHSWAVIIGSILVPLIFVSTWVFSYEFIDYMIGENASGRHGYALFFIIVLYPIIVPFYWLICWFIDLRIKKKYLLR